MIYKINIYHAIMTIACLTSAIDVKSMEPNNQLIAYIDSMPHELYTPIFLELTQVTPENKKWLQEARTVNKNFARTITTYLHFIDDVNNPEPIKYIMRNTFHTQKKHPL